ncbi:MAG: class I SAM-dependent DNA methyltransferase [Helicobacter sp.]|nr:class I SAM-dependent DNA methyltransferase [Helicobacter sp.]
MLKLANLGKIPTNDSGEDSLLMGISFELRNDKYLEFVSKILSKEFLHNEFKQDSNALNPKFYFELLHIFGLKERNESGKILIEIDQSQKISFAKHIASRLESQNKPSDFETTMSHIILWLNRILFLKLIEANLLHFNNLDENLRFLTSKKITSFSTLAHLFFEVLAKDYVERESDKGFNFLPYLNSSLFIRDEKEICDLSTLDDDLQILPFSATQTEYKKNEPTYFLAYLFDFLECFDFGKSQDSVPSDKLINSSVLGAMFEKLNGYQEGSFYTPNFITSYMCKESLQKVVLEKFNALNPQWNARTLEDIEDEIRQEKRNAKESRAKIKEKYIKLLESVRICDPSVGSGHFLVSALSEMVSIYYRLGLLEIDCDDLRILDDEIYLKIDKENFAYKRPQSNQNKNHQIQITLFNLKKSIIENNLFGVDINPNSCNIARLRLWIELLKNAYYLNFDKDKDSKIHKLQTLPNIDINIKCGNSLVSYFDIQISLAHYPNIGTKMQDYKQIVQNYKEGFYQDKFQIDQQIKVLLQTFKNFCFKDKFKKEIKGFDTKCEEYSRKYGNYLAKDDKDLSLYVPQRMFVDEFDMKVAQKEFDALKKEYESIFNLESNKPFEWRFAFPEVLDSNGDFLGFDLVIGNPPYIRQEEIKHLKPQLQKAFEVYKGTSDIYTYFYELGFKILKNPSCSNSSSYPETSSYHSKSTHDSKTSCHSERSEESLKASNRDVSLVSQAQHDKQAYCSKGGILSFITSNKWCRAAYGEPLRKFLLENTTIDLYLDLNGIKVFESATVDTSILEFHKAKADENHSLNYANPKEYNPKDEKPLLPQYSKIAQNTLSEESFIFSDSKLAALKAKIESIGTPLKDWDISINYGIKTGYNEAFIIDATKREEILKACDDSKASLLPYPLKDYDENLNLHNPPPNPLRKGGGECVPFHKGGGRVECETLAKGGGNACHSEPALNTTICHSEPALAGEESHDAKHKRDVSASPQHDNFRGKTCLTNNIIYLTEKERTTQLIKPILRGRDIKRYSYEWAGLWIIGTFPALKLDIEDYPAVKNYLLTFGKRLEQSGEKNIDGIRGNNARKKTSNKWFETQDNIAYYNEFAKPKIVWNPVSGEYFFSYIKEMMYFNNSLFMMTHKDSPVDSPSHAETRFSHSPSAREGEKTGENPQGKEEKFAGEEEKIGECPQEGEEFVNVPSFSKENKDDFLLYILGLMNSKLYRWLITQMTNLIDEGKYAYGAKDKIEKLPIPRLDKKQELEFVRLVKEMIQIKQTEGATLVAHNEQTKILESKLDSMVYALYGLDNEEIAIIGGGGGKKKLSFAL